MFGPDPHFFAPRIYYKPGVVSEYPSELVYKNCVEFIENYYKRPHKGRDYIFIIGFDVQ
jgi:hypothetical protein